MSTHNYKMNDAFLDYYRCPASFGDFALANQNAGEGSKGYFEFGPGETCYGRVFNAAPAGSAAPKRGESVPDLSREVRIQAGRCALPFNPTEVATNLRRERYVEETETSVWKTLARKIYYALRPVFPVSVRRHLQRKWLKGWQTNPFPRWPVDATVDRLFERMMRLKLEASGLKRIPFIWFWPEAKSSCAVMTHDVETAAGLNYSAELMDINDSFQIKSSFQLIPDARYKVTADHLSSMKSRGFEVNVHDLKHDGHLFDEEESFRRAAVRINEFGVRFGSRGFRSAILYRNQEWFDALDFAYDMSVPNVGHLDPQRGGCCTVMPYFVGNLLEIPVTATQDYTLFHVLNTYSTELWRQQIETIMRHHGLISFIIHPDYLDTPEAKGAYTQLLTHLSELRAAAGVWIALPGEVDTWWRQRSAMRLVADESGWHVEGQGAERAVVAYAALKDEKVTYEYLPDTYLPDTYELTPAKEFQSPRCPPMGARALLPRRVPPRARG